jgi:hypothetical protein
LKSTYLLLFFYILISFYYVFVTQSDIRLNYYEDGLLLSDDRNYYEASINKGFNKKTKNYFYYLYNEFFTNIHEDVILIILSNTIIFVLCFVFFLKSYELKPNKYFLLAFLFFPVFFVNSINYKDSLFMSMILVFFATRRNRNINIIFKIVLLLISIIIADKLRLGTGFLMIFTLFTFYILKFFKMRRLYVFLYFVFFTFTFIFVFDYLLNLLGRSIGAYWENQLRNIWHITPFFKINVLVTGVTKTLLQFNIYSYLKFIEFGEHGFNGLSLKIHYLLYCIAYPFVLIIIFANKNRFKLCEFSIFVIFYVIIYSYIYGGLIGFRLSCLFVLLFMIRCCFKNKCIIYEKK